MDLKTAYSFVPIINLPAYVFVFAGFELMTPTSLSQNRNHFCCSYHCILNSQHGAWNMGKPNMYVLGIQMTDFLGCTETVRSQKAMKLVKSKHCSDTVSSPTSSSQLYRTQLILVEGNAYFQPKHSVMSLFISSVAILLLQKSSPFRPTRSQFVYIPTPAVFPIRSEIKKG